jgi:hypothetical protein
LHVLKPAYTNQESVSFEKDTDKYPKVPRFQSQKILVKEKKQLFISS